MPPKTFKIITLGCKVNQYESAYLGESLADAGLSLVGEKEEADVTVINTCTVTQGASYQSRQLLRRAVRENPWGVTAAVGCYAQVYPSELTEIEGVDLIAGNVAKGRLRDLLLNGNGAQAPRIFSHDFRSDAEFDFLPIKRFGDRTRGFLKIQDGCQSFCSYCVVPIARGPLRSLDPSKVLGMMQSLAESGYREVVLTGVNLGKYGCDLHPQISLRDLLRLIGREDLPLRVRLSSIEPTEIDEALIETIAFEPWLCPHFHIPLQSGDDGILKRMNRTYTARDFMRLVERIHEKMPHAAIGVDTIAGFPDEDRNAYRNTAALVRDLPISYLHVFPYSARKGTAAAGFSDRVPRQVVKERAAELRELGLQKRRAFHESCLGKIFAVLVEGWQSKEDGTVKGLSENYLRVAFTASRLTPNDLVPIKMEAVMEQFVFGRSMLP
jgi:threonylcarbamoyladenosine tRNA methylthiotransferase MtaB